jgi:hypothetical protein
MSFERRFPASPRRLGRRARLGQKGSYLREIESISTLTVTGLFRRAIYNIAPDKAYDNQNDPRDPKRVQYTPCSSCY